MTRTITIGNETFECCDHGYIIDDGKWCPYPGCDNGYDGNMRRHPSRGNVRRVRCQNKWGTVWYQWRPTREPLLREVKL